jgi:hypothetical protein
MKTEETHFFLGLLAFSDVTSGCDESDQSAFLIPNSVGLCQQYNRFSHRSGERALFLICLITSDKIQHILEWMPLRGSPIRKERLHQLHVRLVAVRNFSLGIADDHRIAR